jgi:ribosomal protein RSM22 (predicted rRNA methylase)
MERFNSKGPAEVSLLTLKVLEQAIHEGLPGRPRRISFAVEELSRLFTRERTGLTHRYLDDPERVAAYLSYFLPVNLSKIQVLLDELPPEPPLEQEVGRLSVLDLGSGPGTGALAVLDWLHARRPEVIEGLSITSVDCSPGALEQAESLWRAYCREAGISGVDLRTCEGDLERLFKRPAGDQLTRGAPYDLIIMANCLNELFCQGAEPAVARAGLIAELVSLLTPHGTVMVVEPALRQTARDLHLVRDRLILEGRCTVYSPCLHERNCPALVHPDDWCHEERAWKTPSLIKEIDQEVGFIKDALKFSYLLLRTDGRTIVPRHPGTFRLVSELRVLKGDTRAWLCNELGRSEVGRLDRARSASNAAWDLCHRGTIVRLEGVKRKEGSTLERIPAEGTVKIIRPV